MKLPRDVKALGAVSFLNDASSEMIYPLLPAFVVGTLGAGPAFLGALEGLAESVAALLKLAAGVLSDRLPRRKPLVLAGYGLASAARPWIALATLPGHALAVRLLERAGKGLRTAPRDALLASAAPAAERGRAVGFHRAMDHAGAAVGPLVAALLLSIGLELRVVFALAGVPAVLTVLVLVFGVREAGAQAALAADAPRRAPGPLPRRFKLFLGLAGLFALGFSSDAFVLLKAQEVGVPLAALPLLWTLHHVVKSAAGTSGGALADRLGRRRVLGAGWLLYALVYLGFAAASRAWHVWALSLVYALYFALCEGAEKALVADLAGEGQAGRAFGLFHGLTGAMLLPASALAGALWEWRGAAWAFGLGALLALVAALGLFALVPEPRDARPQAA